jgi:protein-S-isoprenylcysteine O-methyltransferase Ste14
MGAWLVSAMALVVLKRKRGGRLPSGAIALKNPMPLSKSKPPGTGWSRAGIVIGMGVNSFLTFFIFSVYILDLWNVVAPYIAVELPTVINWIGVLAIWGNYVWGTAVTYYNVNYVPANRSMEGKRALFKSEQKTYVLATGGPYRWVRHPMYVSKILFGLFLFLTTGVWLTVFTIVAVIALPAQAKGEEEALHRMFGVIYDDYAAGTGRFFPRRRH